MKLKKRVSVNCRDFPNETDCTLLISGSRIEVFKTALRHAMEEHGHKDTTELRKQLRTMMKNDVRTKKIKKIGKETKK